MGESETSAEHRAHAVGTTLRIAFPLAGVFLLTLGMLGTVSYGVMPVVDALRSRNWHPVAARVEAVTLEPPGSVLHPPLDRVSLRYRYVYDNVEYVGGRLDPQDGLFTQRRSRKVVERLQASPELEVWVNPANPRESLARRELRAGVALFAVPAFAMAVAGSISLFAGMLAWNNIPTGIRRRGADPS